MAFDVAHVHHRDLSRSNMMMTELKGDAEGPRGVLIDWDHAKRIGALSIDPVLLRTVCNFPLTFYAPLTEIVSNVGNMAIHFDSFVVQTNKAS